MNYNIIGMNNELIAENIEINSEELNFYHKLLYSRYKRKLRNEYFDILDHNSFEKTGNIKLRDLVHEEGDWHGAFHLHIIRINEDDVPCLVLQKRKNNKDVNPGKFDAVVGGHYSVGERMEDGVREIEEEIGLKVRFKDLIGLGRRIHYDYLINSNIINLQLHDVFLLKNNKPISEYRMQEEELEGILEIPVNQIIRLFKREISEIRAVNYLGFDDFGNQVMGVIDVKRSDFIPAPYDNYYLKTALIIENYLKGHLQDNPYDLDVSKYF